MNKTAYRNPQTSSKIKAQAICDWTGEPVKKKYSEDEYRRLFFKEDRLVGAVMIGFTKGQEKIKSMIKEKEKVEDREALLEKDFWE